MKGERKNGVIFMISFIMSLFRMYESDVYEIRDSPIHGKGQFALSELPAGSVVAPIALYTDERFRVGEVILPAGKFFNHSLNPNGVMREVENGYWVYVTTRNVEKNEELTLDYNDTPSWILKPAQLGFK